MRQIFSQFSVTSEMGSCARYGSGHINDTYKVVCVNGEEYIMQRINTHVFADPDALMHNIRRVTDHLARGAASSREVLTLIPTREGGSFARVDGDCWRVYEFVRDSVCVDLASSPAQFAQSAAAFGRFFNQLSDFPAGELFETIAHFHDTPARFAALQQAIREDSAGRVKEALPEIDAALSYERYAHTLTDMQRAGELPLRVTHNDTKINNVLFDRATGRGLCVIDLDTVMPGLILNDFGDSIRFGASTALEDERDLGKVNLDLGLYETYLRAYLDTCGGALTQAEIDCLPDGAKMMTYECGIRFLADYLSGDPYFHTAYPRHNLDRARTQLKLVADMDQKWGEMQRVLREARGFA